MNHTIELDGKSYPFTIGIAALVRAEQITGKSLLNAFEPSLEVFAAIGYGALFTANSGFDMPYEDYLNLLTPEHFNHLIEAYSEAMPDPKKKAPPKKKRTSRSSPGKKSTASGSED